MNDFTIFSGWRPGLIGLTARLHGVYYAASWGFGTFFEAWVAQGMSDFALAFDPARDGVWSVWGGEDLAGVVAVQGKGDGVEEGTCRLRWFIVDPQAQGRGIGGRLLSKAVAHARDACFTHLSLWTFKGLDAARALYERAGFVLCEEAADARYGTVVVNQRFVLELTHAGVAPARAEG
jgi:GNAT superfamily N-acetyltransferase